MRLFGYYAWHSFVNQLRKLFKTWMLIFLAVCFLFGCLIGFGMAALEDAAEPEEPAVVEEDITEEDLEALQAELDISPMDLSELIAGGLILAVLVFVALGADKSGNQIFLPADVNTLFASPMKPQSVLLFRLMTQLGTSLLASLYLLFQLPNLTLNLGLSVWASIAIILTWCLTLAVSKLVQILLYTVCSTHTRLKRWLRYGIFGLLLLLAAAYYLYWKASGLGYLQAAAAFFNGGISRLIPLWGWLKGFCMCAIEGNAAGSVLYLAVIVAGGAVLAYIIWHVKADFYEDALSKTQETAELLEQAQAEKGVAIIKRKKDRSDRLRRDGMKYGSGANVFFFKAMYNRFRFAHLGVFTKTSETYLLAALGVAALCRFVFEASDLLPVMLTLGVFVFFRSLGNPLAEDTQMNHFLLIPESTWRKLFWSLLGGTANCFLDLLPAVVAAPLLLGVNPLTALAWLPLIVSVDFFATTVGVFINLSVSPSISSMIKQIIQVMFIYFGLLPDVAVMAVGLVFGQPAWAAVGCTVLNILLGLLFFALTPLFLESKEGKTGLPEPAFAGNLKKAGKHFSRLGLGAFVILAAGSVLQLLAGVLAELLWPQWMSSSWGMWLVAYVPLYLIAVPLGLWIFRAVPARVPERAAVKPGRFAVAAIISIFMMYAGNLVGTLVTTLLQGLSPLSAANPVESMVTDTALLPRALFVVVLAPIIEEYIFRKQLIDRMRNYGEKLAVITSALMFGLFHGNLSQLFYAFALGLVFGYVYVRSGKLRYSIALHMFINFLGGVLAPFLLEKLAVLDAMQALDEAALMELAPWLLAFLGYAFTLVGLAVAGLVLLCINARKLTFTPAELELPKKQRFRTVWVNAGMLLLLAACLALIVLSLL